MEYVHELDQSTLKKLGLQLGLLDSTLSKLSDETKPEGYGMKVMSAWLNRRDNVDSRGGPTWISLAKALKHRTVGCIVQGEQIPTDLREGTLSNQSYNYLIIIAVVVLLVAALYGLFIFL